MALNMNRYRLTALVLVSLTEIFLFGGLQFGWFSLVYILKEDGVFSNLCIPYKHNSSGQINGTEDDNCFPQDERLNLLFSIGIAVTTGACFLVGQLHFRFDFRKIRILSVLVGVTGLLCCGFTSSDLPWLVLPGLILCGMAGHSFMISNMQISYILPCGSSLYVGVLAGCFESSVFTQMVVKKLYENGTKRIFSYTGLSVLYIVISGICTILHPSHKKSESTSETSKGSVNHSFRPEGSTDGIVNDYDARADGLVNKCFENENNLKVKPEDHDNNYKETADDGELVADSFRPNGNGLEPVAGRHDYDVHSNELKEIGKQSHNESKTRVRKSEVEIASCSRVKQEANNSKPITPKDDVKAEKFRQILCSRMLLSHLAWTSTTLLRCYYFIGSVNRFLGINIDSDSQVSFFLDVMSYTMLGGFLSSFIAGNTLQIQHRWFTGPMRLVIPLTVTSFLSILLSSLAFVSATAVYYVDFVVVTSLRSFIYCVNLDFIRSAFPKRYMSIIFGLVLSVAGTFNLTQYALFAWTEVYSDAMTHVNICLLCLSIISLLHPIQIYCFERRIQKNENDK